VDLTTAPEYLKAGAVCLGVGGQLVDPRLLESRDFARLTALARQFVEIVKKHRSG
jgi:2-dehydro-3-deoxyphosphogluconate aldolase/(4S)-4-hydroxy-2-oxoglutarate aldolase